MIEDFQKEYSIWKNKAVDDPDLIPEMENMDADAIMDAFSRDLSFGTGGLRGIIGAGTNRMNIYTVARATQGLAKYICDYFEAEKRSVVIAYDTRRKSKYFADVAAQVLLQAKITTYIFREPMPTPALSFAVRRLGCAAGVVITASHNPADYNGFKVYDKDGCQITNRVADAIKQYILDSDYFPEQAVIGDNASEMCAQFVSDEILSGYIYSAVEEGMIMPIESIDTDLSIVYTPLHGTGLKPVTEAIVKAGFEKTVVVEEQKQPDANFTTCPKPNPEEVSAMELGLIYCSKVEADILIATDPDCDRVAIAVRDKSGTYRLMSTNEVGVLILN